MHKKKVLVLNGSPKRNNSSTMKITNAFLEGLNYNNDYEIEIINVIDLNIKPCTGCLSCWGRTEGNCVIKNDDVNKVKEKIENSDIVIESFPLYFFSMPGIMKLLTDRLLSMMKTYEGQRAIDDSKSFHGIRNPKENQKLIVISSCAYTETDKAFESLEKQYNAICGKNDYTKIFVSQVKTLIDLNNESRTKKYLQNFIYAGKYFHENQNLSEDLLRTINKNPFGYETYKHLLDIFWEEERKKGKNIID